jgi:hypothetical protein
LQAQAGDAIRRRFAGATAIATLPIDNPFNVLFEIGL